MKIDIDDIGLTIAKYNVDKTTADKIIADLAKQAEDNKAPKQPKTKSCFFLVKPKNQADGKDVGVYLFKSKISYDLKNIEDSIGKVRVEYNNSKKAKKFPANTAIDTIELAKSKNWKNEDLQVLCREPLVIIEIENQNGVPTNSVNNP